MPDVPELILVPDLFIPIWAQDDDRLYLVFQPYIRQKIGETAALAEYLGGFAVPGFATPPRPKVVVRLVSANEPALAADEEFVPVPLPDTIALQVDLLRPGPDTLPSSDVVVSTLIRDFRQFATFVDFYEHIRANRLVPLRFLAQDDEARKRGWWQKIADPSDPDEYQPERFNGDATTTPATFAEAFAFQQLNARRKATSESSETGLEGLSAQLQLAFGIGRRLRLFRDDQTSLFGGLAADLGSDVMVVPDTFPGEDWHAALAAHKRRWHTNIHSLCGLVWPLFTRKQLADMVPDELPIRIRFTLTVPGGAAVQNVSTNTGQPLLFPDPTSQHKDFLTGYCRALRTTGLPTDLGVHLDPPDHFKPPHAVDYNQLVFAVPKDRPFEYDPDLIPRGDKRSLFVFRDDASTTTSALPADPAPGVDDDDLAPLPLLSTADYSAVSVLTNESFTSFPEVHVRLAIVVRGQLQRFRKYPQSDDRKLLVFRPDFRLPAALRRDLLMRIAGGTGASPRLIAPAAADRPEQRAEIADAAVHCIGYEGLRLPAPNLFHPVFLFDDRTDAQVKELLDRPERTVFLIFPLAGQDFPGKWRRRYGSAASKLELYLWRSDPIPVGSATVSFNAAEIDLDPPAQRSEFGLSLRHRNEYDFQLARSARQFWLPFRIRYPRREAGADFFRVDAVEDAWAHKQLNVYVAPRAGQPPNALLNRDSLGLPANQEPQPGQSLIDVDRRRSFGFYSRHERTIQDLTDDLLREVYYPAAPAGYKLRFTHWPRDIFPSRQPLRTDESTQRVRVGIEHQYGTELCPLDDAGQLWQVDFKPWIDWPITDATSLRWRSNEPGDGTPFLSFAVPQPAGGQPSILNLLVHGEWQNEQALEPGGSNLVPVPAKLRSQCQEAAQDLLDAGAIMLRVTGYVFDWQRDESADGSRHDRRFAKKLRPVVLAADNATVLELVVAGQNLTELRQRLSRRDSLDKAKPGEMAQLTFSLSLPNGKRLHEIVTFAQCELVVRRPPTSVPDAEGQYAIFEPQTDQLAGSLSAAPPVTPASASEPDTWEAIPPLALLDPVLWARFFQPRSEAPVRAQLRQFLVRLGEMRAFVSITPPRDPTLPKSSPGYYQSIRLLTEMVGVLAPEGDLAEALMRLRHGFVPLAFLPLPTDPVLSESTAEVSALLLQVMKSYVELELAEFATLGRELLKAHLAKLHPAGVDDYGPFDKVAEALARTLQPIAREGSPLCEDNLCTRLAADWRFTTSVPLTPNGADAWPWPQAFAKKSLAADLVLYQGAKAVLVHALRSVDAGAGQPPISGRLYKFRVNKDASEDADPAHKIGADIDDFVYMATTTYRGASPERGALVSGDILDDLTYDNQFAVQATAYHSGEEYVEWLGRNTAANGQDPPESEPMANAFGLIDSGLERPFGPAVPPGPSALIPLIARRTVTRPQIIFARPMPHLSTDGEKEVQFGGSEGLQFLPDLPMLGRGVLEAPGSPPAFERTHWLASDAPQKWDDQAFRLQLNGVTFGYLVAFSADEEGQFERDVMELRASPFDSKLLEDPPPTIVCPIPQPEVEQLRRQGPLQQALATVEKWLGLDPADPKGPLQSWIGWLAERALHAPSLGAVWQEGTILFGKDAANNPTVASVHPPGGQEMRVSIYKPISQASETAPPGVHILAVELRMAAGESSSQLAFRQVRNRRPEGAPAFPFDPDPRFVQLSQPSLRSDPIRATRRHDFAASAPVIPSDRALKLPTADGAGLDLDAFLGRLEQAGVDGGHPFTFRRREDLLRGSSRVAIYFAGTAPAARFTFDDLSGGKIDDRGLTRPFREAVLVFRFNEKDDAGNPLANPRIYLPPDRKTYRIDIRWLSEQNAEYLELVQIPATPQ